MASRDKLFYSFNSKDIHNLQHVGITLKAAEVQEQKLKVQPTECLSESIHHCWFLVATINFYSEKEKNPLVKYTHHYTVYLKFL